MDAVQAGVPILYSPGPLMGATGPATVAGTVGLTTAEVLFGLVLMQLIKPGAPVVLKPDTDVFDMKTTQCTYGSPEQNLGKVAMAQLAASLQPADLRPGRRRRGQDAGCRGGRRGDDEHAAQRPGGHDPVAEPGHAGVGLYGSPGDGGHLRRAGAHDQARAGAAWPSTTTPWRWT